MTDDSYLIITGIDDQGRHTAQFIVNSETSLHLDETVVPIIPGRTTTNPNDRHIVKTAIKPKNAPLPALAVGDVVKAKDIIGEPNGETGFAVHLVDPIEIVGHTNTLDEAPAIVSALLNWPRPDAEPWDRGPTPWLDTVGREPVDVTQPRLVG